MGQAVYVCVLDCRYGTRGICLCVYIRLSLMGHTVYVCVCVCALDCHLWDTRYMCVY